MEINFYLVYFAIVSSLLVNIQISAERVLDCIDNLQDFEKSGWRIDNSEFEYAETSEDLPGVLKDKFDGNGIFHAEGGIFPRQIMKDSTALQSGPTVIYVKYYNHAKEPDQFSFVSPAENANFGLKRLNNTSNFEWAEGFINIDEERMLEIGVRIGSFFYYGETFLVDRFILAQGDGVENSDIDSIKKLCWGQQDFVCEENGSFADPHNCSIYHVCQLIDGQPWDSVMPCPETTVWCQQKKQCDYPSVCPCSIA